MMPPAHRASVLVVACAVPMLVSCAAHTPEPDDAPPARSVRAVGDLDVIGEDFWRAVRDRDEVHLLVNAADHLRRPAARVQLEQFLGRFFWLDGHLKSGIRSLPTTRARPSAARSPAWLST